jgi:hypothetical protein
MFTQQFVNVMLAPNVHVFGTPNNTPTESGGIAAYYEAQLH